MNEDHRKQVIRGRGRPRLDEGAPTVRVSVQLTEPQKEKLSRLGGSAWVRTRIDKAKEPPQKQ